MSVPVPVNISMNRLGIIVQSTALAVGALTLDIMLIQTLLDRTSAVAAKVVAFVVSFVFTYLAVRSQFTRIAVTVDVLTLVSPFRTKVLPWSQVEQFEIRAWFGGPALFVRTSDGARHLLPLAAQTQRLPALEALHARLGLLSNTQVPLVQIR